MFCGLNAHLDHQVFEHFWISCQNSEWACGYSRSINSFIHLTVLMGNLLCAGHCFGHCFSKTGKKSACHHADYTSVGTVDKVINEQDT